VLQIREQQPETLDRHAPARDPPAAVARPQPPVDRVVARQREARERQPQPPEGRRQRQPLGPIEVQQRVVEVEQDCAQACQREPTSRGR
jgi:hypothetical protein